MDGRWRDGTVVVGGDARQRFHDARGYGRPRSGNEIALAPVEAAHLLYRGDLDSVDGMGFRSFLAETGTVLGFVVYKDFRDRGFYLSPADGDVDFLVRPRGADPGSDEVRYRVRVVGEREPIPAGGLGDVVLAVVDEDGELTYFGTGRPAFGEGSAYEPPSVRGDLLEDRVIVWEPPADLYDRGFYGRRLGGRTAEGGPLQLSLVEAAYLARRGDLEADVGASELVARGRGIEGDRFERRLGAYAALRDRGVVPKSGFKFGADFRAYEGFEAVDDIGHSDDLIRVVAPDHAFLPRDLSLDVRLANGVRKRMVFALVGDGVDWLSVERLTP